jgi:hypothetical protein
MSVSQFDELAKNMNVNVHTGNIDKGDFEIGDGNELDEATECELLEPSEGDSKAKDEGFAQETGLANNMAAKTGATLLFSMILLGGGYIGWQQFFPSAKVAQEPPKTDKANGTENPINATVTSNNAGENPADATQQQEATPQSALSTTGQPTDPQSADPNSPANPVGSPGATATVPNATGTTPAGTANSTNGGTPTAVTTKPSPPIANSPKNPSANALAGKASKATPTPAPIFVPTQVAPKNIPNTAVAKSATAPIVTAANPVGTSLKSASVQKSSISKPSSSDSKPTEVKAAKSQNDTASAPVVTALAPKPARPQPSAFSGISNIGSSSRASRNIDSVATLPPPPLNPPSNNQQSQSRDLPTATVGDSEVYGMAKALPGSAVDQATVAALPPPPLNPPTDTPPPKSDEAPPLTDYLTAQLDPSIAVVPQSQDNIPPPPIAPLAPPAIASSSPPPALPSSDVAPPSNTSVALQPQNTNPPLIENGLPPGDAAPISNAKLDTNIPPQPEAKNTPSNNDGAVIVPPPSPETLSPLPVNPPQSRIMLASANTDLTNIFWPSGSGWTPKDFGAADRNKASEKEPKTTPSDIPIIDESVNSKLP